jgi:hypothetical protein
MSPDDKRALHERMPLRGVIIGVALTALLFWAPLAIWLISRHRR